MKQIRGRFSVHNSSLLQWRYFLGLGFLKAKWDPGLPWKHSSDESWKVNNDFVVSDSLCFTRTFCERGNLYQKRCTDLFALFSWAEFLRHKRLLALAQKRCKLHFTLLPRNWEPYNLPVLLVKEVLEKKSLDCKVLVQSGTDWWYGLK